jgi:hypothetical protein
MADQVVLEESKAMSEKYEVVHQKPETLYGEYERKSDLKHLGDQFVRHAVAAAWAIVCLVSCEQ